MGFGAHPIDHVWIVQLESRPLRADARQLGEVVPRRRATGGPFQRVAVAPRVVDGDRLAVAPALEHVPGERDDRYAQDKGPDGGDAIERLESVGGQVVGVAARHALITEPVLYQKGGVEANQG